MTIQADIQALNTRALIELFEVDISPITGTNTAQDRFYFHAGTNQLTSPVVWQGQTYSPMPVQVDGFEMTTKGTAPRPRLRIANVSGAMTAVNLETDDMVGAKITRRRTFSQYLDAVNFPGGVNPTADPGQHLPDDVYFVDRKVTENNVMVEWELASSLDLEQVVLPARSIIASYCTWQYRVYRNGAFDYSDVEGCSYTGSNYFTIQGVSTNDPSLDVCSKTLKACKLRFGTSAVLPFGGFPGVKVYRV